MADGDSEVTANELGDWIGCSVASVLELVRCGVIERTGRGRYPLKDSVRRYAKYMRKAVTGRGEGTPAEAKGRLARAQAELAEMKARRLSSELVPLTVRT